MSFDAAPNKRRRRILLGLGAAALILAAAVTVFVLTHGPGDVSNPDVEFRADETTPAPATGGDDEARKDKAFLWPLYGYSADRRRQVDVPRTLRPPFKRKWFYDGGVLLEFPPVISAKLVFILGDDGRVAALDKETGKVRWRRTLGSLAASSPALDGDRLYLTVLERRGTGRAVALDARTGRQLWARELPSRTESSPVVAAGAVYFGSENGTVYALRERDGAVRWTFKAAGAVKAGLALKDGKLFFGDYAGKLYAIRASDGKQVWQAKTKGASFGFAAGRFYSTPAVAYGRVYIGNVDSYVYSFSARTGELAWRTKTNGFVYASPAVGAAPGDKPTVYAGSYDGTFYALDARSGSVRWRFSGGSRISGGATLLGDIVYFADLGSRRTFGLGARTGRKVFEFPRGGYNPVVTDRKTIFLVGYGAMYALEPLSQAKKRKRARRAVQRRRDCVRQAKRAFTRNGRRRMAFRRCVERTNASRRPLKDLPSKGRESKPSKPSKPRDDQIPDSFRDLIDGQKRKQR